MSDRITLGAIGILFVILGAAPVTGQTQKKNPTPNGYKVPHTPDGQPDLQGIWSNAILTPLERPRELAGKEFFTEKEAAEYEKKTLAGVNVDRGKSDVKSDSDVIGTYEDLWKERGKIAPSLRTSLVIDPQDGRIPPRTPEGQKRAADRAEQRKVHGFDGPENRSVRERCIVATNTAPLVAAGNYDSNYQIVQTPGYVVILSEQIHDARIIPLDGRPHLPPSVRQWMGDARGHWEGNTLVVETTNFTDEGNFQDASAGLRLTEHFTRTGPGIILYEFTMDDPATFTRPWTAQLPLFATPGPIFEYACHEANYSLANLLSGARAEEKKAADTKAKQSR